MRRSGRSSTSRGSSNGTRAARAATTRSSGPPTPCASTTTRERSPLTAIDLDDLGFDRGAHLLVDRALAELPVGSSLEVRGRDPHLHLHLTAWARQRGHRVEGCHVVKGSAPDDRWRHAERAGQAGSGMVVEHASPSWGLAARGALIEAGG